MPATPDPTEKFEDTITCITEAACLHVKLKSYSTKEAVATALVWRYGISDWEAKQCYNSALKLLDALPKRP